MPIAPTPPCPQYPCGKMQPCPDHAALHSQAEAGWRGTFAERGYPADWAKRRLRILDRDPVCRACELELSTEVDHIVPLDRGGSNEDANLQGLDKVCHSRKTALEQRIKDPVEVMALVRAEGRRGRVPEAQA